MLIFTLFSLLALLGKADDDNYDALIEANTKLKEIQQELERLLMASDLGGSEDSSDSSDSDDSAEPKHEKPHILFFLADDYGWANIGYHNQDNKEVRTPTLNKLVKRGVELDRFYTYNQCGPSRSALLSGRNANHVNWRNNGAMSWNPKNPEAGYGGVPPNMTVIGSKMKEGGYKTAYSGKWDIGFASVGQMPYYNGFDHFLGYLQHANSYCSTKTPFQALGSNDVCQSRFFDFWKMDETGYYPSELAGTAYEEEFFLEHSLDFIKNHDPKDPMFLFHSSHLLHTPLQIPEVWLKNFTDMKIRGKSDFLRRQYNAMTQYMDWQVSELVKALKEKGMWKNTLFVFMADNGGPVYTPAAANNWPHRGGKATDFEGGIRVNAFVSGGYIPKKVRGTKTEEVGYVADWYKTFCNLAKVDWKDERAEEYGLPPVDGIDLWPMITGTGNGRNEIYISAKTVILGKYKFMTGMHGFDMRTGMKYPNNTCGNCVETEDGKLCDDCRQPGPSSGYWLPCVEEKPGDNVCIESARGDESFAKFESYPKQLEDDGGWVTDCNANGKKGCLFNIFEDPEEHVDLGDQEMYEPIVDHMLERLVQLNKTMFDPDRGGEHFIACIAGFYYGGYLGPFLDIHGKPIWDLNSETQASPSCDACEVKSIWHKGQKEHCVYYPDGNTGFTCTPYIDGQCLDLPAKPFINGRNAPEDAVFLCGHDTKSWAENVEQPAGEDFYYVETAANDLMGSNQYDLREKSMAFPYPDVCPVLGIEQAESPVNLRRN